MFTLKRYKVVHKNREIYNCDFVIDVDKRGEAFTTLILGENGSGKSYLLQVISDFIRSARQNFKNSSFKYDFVELEYSFGGDLFLIKKNEKEFSYSINGKGVKHSALVFPSNICALSFMVNDKFTYSSGTEEFYKYLGVRTSSNATYTSSIQKSYLFH